ncbi:AMP-binding enzyme-domain-containing protein [Poronia punctata]|nr:AMP-binding enzyme-domain-containing protein [Poronia punctata]
MWLFGGGGLRGIVCTSTFSLTASAATIYRCQLSFLHPLSATAIPSRLSTAASRSARGHPSTSSAGGRAFATYTTTCTQPSTPPSTTTCFRRSFFPAQPRKSSNLNRMASTLVLPKFPIFEAISRHDPHSIAVAHCLSGRTFKYGELLPDVCRVRDQIHAASGKEDIRGERIAFLVENSYDYVVTFLAILASRAIAVPLSPPFPAPELQYVLTQSQASLLLHSTKFAAKAQEVLQTPWPEPSPNTDPKFEPTLKSLELTKHIGLGRDNASFDTVAISEDADTEGAGMMLYTSGTTARPKGVLLPETALTAQSRALIEAWKYSPQDRLLHVLPLHHIHGTVNAILTPLFAGSSIEFLFPFNADTVWRRFANPFLGPLKAKGLANGPSSTLGVPSLPSALSRTASEAPSTGATTPVSVDTTLSAADTTRISQIAAELYGMISLAAGSNGSPETNGIVLSPREATRISQLAVDLNEVVRPRPARSTPLVTTALANSSTNSTVSEDKFANMSREKITFFTVVPTVYTRLLSTHKALTLELAEAGRVATSPEHMRVAISGSAALPTPVKRAWKDLSRGNVLLERYGMTEVGMALSCGLEFADRVDGSVGWPLPGVEARLFDTDTNEIIPPNELDRAGEIQLRGANVFREYWANPTATAKEFMPAEDGKGPWFKTGDVAVRRDVPAPAGSGSSGEWAKGPMFFILGRQSADIIKSGGEKVSALEVERELLSLPEVLETAVMAVPSGKWGQKVGAVVILDRTICPEGWKPMDMRRALKGRLANYKIPQVLRLVDHIPRNAMGKINKKDLLRKVFLEDFSGDEM